MGLLDIFKGDKKEKEPLFCYRCNKDCSGFMAAMKLSDGRFACNDCYPFPTKLMNQKGVMDDEFKQKTLSSTDADKLINYRTADQKRQVAFKCEEKYLNGELLVDRQHMWFRLKKYEEVFFIQQITMLCISEILEKDDKYYFTVLIALSNQYYKRLFVDTVVKPDAFFKKKRVNQVLDYISDFHQKFCPNAALELVDFM